MPQIHQVYLTITFLFFNFITSTTALDNVITPDVTIVDEKPSVDTGRVQHLQNKTVIISALLGEGVILICNIFNMFASARVIWRRVSFDRSVMETVNDGLMSRDMSRWKIGQGKQTNSVRLEILSVDQTYEGYYSCECQYTGSVEPARAERILKVVAVPTINNFQSSYDTTVNEGDRVTLRCEAHGIPPPVITWRRTGGSSSLIRNYGNMKPGELIQFDRALPDDEGTYMCRAENDLGSAYWPVRLYVRHAPRLRVFTVLPAPRFSCNVQLLCEITANPAPLSTQVRWTNQTGQQIRDAPESSIMPGWSINRPQCVAHLQRLCLSLLLTSAALSSTYSLTWLN